MSYPLRFLGGRLCLDFANTVDWRLDERRRKDLLSDYGALLAWSRARGTLPSRAIRQLGALARKWPHAAGAAWRDAIALRSEIWRLAERLDAGSASVPTALNRRLRALPPQPPLVARPPAEPAFALPGRRLEEPLWPILWSLTALLTSEDARRVHHCEALGCGWYFVDMSPNRTRHWCSAEGCGNRERVRRTYRRRKTAVARPGGPGPR